ncbi:MAG TPA: DNA-binding response regulator [Lachnospiraceae bacterium]|nr:DNA-binding response regulator [Lachnospiraceae bacterium]
MVRVLLVEDDAAMRLLTKTKLKNEYEILEAADGLKALEILDHNHVDLMIVDIMMPNMNGYEFVESLREGGDLTPVILLTAMDSFEHKKKGFERGIDDYLTKPVDYEELKWRMEAILRRAKIMHESQISIGGLVLSEKTMAGTYEGRTIELTEKEFELLYKLLSYPGVLFTKQQLMDEIWGYDTETEYDTIKTYISRLRKKFEDCTVFELVSVRGLGYKAEIR